MIYREEDYINESHIEEQIVEVMCQRFGLTIEAVRLGYARVSAKIEERHKNFMDIVCGGELFNIADLVAGLACISDGSIAVTVSGDIQFIRPAHDVDMLRCEAVVTKRGKHLDFLEARVYDPEDKLVAKANFTYAKTS